MRLSARLRDAMISLGEPPPSATNVVTDEMLRQLASLGIVEYGSDGSVKFTDEGKQVYRDTVGHLPKQNI